MEGESGYSRGRGRGMIPGEERGDLRRPLVTPQSMNVGPIPTTQQQSPLLGVNNYNDNIAGNLQYAPSLKQYQDNFHLQHIRQAQPLQQSPSHIHGHAIQSQITLANPQSQPIHMLQLQVQQQQQQQQVQQQLAIQQQLIHAQQQKPQTHQQIFEEGVPQNSGNVTYLSPVKQEEYQELNRRKSELEQMMKHKNQLQQQQQIQQILFRNQNQQTLEIEQKLASLQMQNPNAIYIQQQQQLQVQLQQQQQQQQQEQQHQQIQQQQLMLKMFQPKSQVQPPHQEILPDRVRNVQLSVEAAEFVPRFGNVESAAPGMPSAAPNMPSAAPNMPNAAPSIPSAASGPQEHVSLIPIQPEYSAHPVVIQVDNAVVQLTGNPSKYEAVSKQLTWVLSWQVKEENLMREVVTVIFEQGVGEANFRFTGGKLCDHIVRNVAQQYNGPSFKSILIQRCQEEYEYRHQYLAMQYYERLIGFTFFLAEMLTRLLMPSGEAIIKLREALCEMLMLLLNVTTNESLKCVAQVLKMSGKYLEKRGRYEESAGEVEAVMEKLRDIAMTPIPPNIKSLLMSVVEFRAANWGCGAEQVNGGTEGTPPSEGDTLPVLGTIFYSPDGVIHHIEEDTVEEYPSDTDDGASNKQLVAPQICELEGEEGMAFDEFLKSMT